MRQSEAAHMRLGSCHPERLCAVGHSAQTDRKTRGNENALDSGVSSQGKSYFHQALMDLRMRLTIYNDKHF